MALLDDIEQYKKETKVTKWRILKEYETEILEMIKLGISIKKQVELVLKNKILTKLDDKEYRNILVKHFGYTGVTKKQVIFEDKQEKTSEIKKPHIQVKPVQTKRSSATDILSEDVDLMSMHLEKQTQD
jgi:hypothetical protein